MPVVPSQGAGSLPPAYHLRPARRTERWLIVRRILRERLDPSQLDWRRFTVAEAAGGAILGFAQLKELRQGVQEFGSLVVEPAARRQGIGTALIRHVIATAPPPVYLLCAAYRADYYRRFGFRELHPGEMPRPLHRKWRAGNFLGRLFGARIVAMVHASPRAPADHGQDHSRSIVPHL